MKESSFRTAVLTKLPKKIHRQPIPQTMQSASGTPDTYIDFNKDLWIEWKSLPGEDYFPLNISGKYLPTEKQNEWLTRRYESGKNAIVIVGFKIKNRAHGVILDSPKMWSNPVPEAKYRELMMSAADLAIYIEARVTES